MNDLPDDVEQLKAMLLALQEANLAKDKLLQAQQEEMAELKTRVELLLEQLNLSKSKRFSSQSEKV
ncbi:IS66 family transposase, partial [Vibrio aestuarianus]|nr:IS66 family transposase [Vibrio aestuarianus]